MPLISTSGALSINKVALGASANYWFLQWNDTYFFVQSIALDSSNQLFCTGSYQVSGFDRWIQLKINQDSGLPLITWQKTLTGYTIQGGYDIYFNRYTNNLYTVGYLNNSSNSDQSAGTLINNRDGTILATYYDDNQFYGASTSYPWRRIGNSILSDSTGDYYIAGSINEKPNSTTNSYLPYYTKFSGGTKIYNKLLPDATTLATSGSSVQMEFTTSGNLLMLVATESQTASTNIITLINIDPATNTINWQNKWGYPIGATGFSGTFTQDNTGNIYVGFNVNSGATAGVYLQKYDSSGTLLWTRKINNGGTISQIVVDNNNYVYLAVLATGGANLNNIIKIDGNYNIQWQRRLTTSSAGKNIQIENIYWDKGNLYLEGGASVPSGVTATSAFIMKVPDTGTIPGTGTYVVSAALTVTYAVNNALTFIPGSQGITATGTLSVTNATTKAYNSVSLTANTTINTTTLTSL